MTRDDRPDYADIVRSPYDPDPDDGAQGGADAVPWVPPVIAAIVGALVVSGFVIYAVVQQPEPEQTQATTTTSVAEPVVVASDTFPEGFTAVTDAVGAKVERFDGSERASVVAVATAVAGGSAPDTVRPLDPAYWVIRNAGVERPMATQYDQAGALGNITVEFEPSAVGSEVAVVPYLADDVVTQVETIELDASLPLTITDVAFELPGVGTIVMEELSIGNGWGWFAWSAPDGRVAKVDVVVTFVGTDDPSTPDDVDPTQLTMPHLRPLTQGRGSLPLPPMYGFAGSSWLEQAGETLRGDNQATGITVELIATAPTSVTRGPVIEIDSGG